MNEFEQQLIDKVLEAVHDIEVKTLEQIGNIKVELAEESGSIKSSITSLGQNEKLIAKIRELQGVGMFKRASRLKHLVLTRFSIPTEDSGKE